ncbi:MAG: transglutaminase domain-containing protein [Myxococcales bacterium]|nr:transglutaminase domain-containing protein [Myxococcales bacterium]
MQRPLPRLAAAAAAMGIAIGVSAAIASRAGRPLHQDLPSPASVDGGRSAAMTSPTPTQNPDVIAAGNKMLPEPDASQPGRPDEPTFGQPGFAADRQTQATLDRQTASDGTLHYVAVFNPDVLPFKRMSALNAIDTSQTLSIAPGRRLTLTVGGAPDMARDRFWGSLMLTLAPDQVIAIPSVAPDMRILSYETEPRAELRFSKDTADNFYVSAPRIKQPVSVRLVMHVDADAGYFAPALPQGRWTPRLVAAQAPTGALARMPMEVRALAGQSLSELGLHQDVELGRAFNALVAYHRAFAAGDAPPREEGTYRDLFSAQVGVCRHRSFVFMITANALGIPTRYVTNEAHAFVEVWFPQRGWQRVDLGGAALNLQVYNGGDKTVHRPRSEDPFAKPDAYRDNYTQLRGDISGLSDTQREEQRDPHAASSGEDTFSDHAGSATAAGADDGTPAPFNAPTLAANDGPPDPRRITPSLSLRADATTKARSESLGLAGTVTDRATGAPLAGLTVQLFLLPLDASLDQAVWIGAAVSDGMGTFSATATVPGSVAVGAYHVIAVTSEDLRHNAGRSD